MKKALVIFVVALISVVSVAELYTIRLEQSKLAAHKLVLAARAEGRINDTQARNLDRYAQDTYWIVRSERVINLLNSKL